MKHAFLALVVGASSWFLAGCATQDRAGQAGATKDEVLLVSGLGPVVMKVSTASPEAQKFFNQGLAYIYAFNHAEAVRSFERAAELDPRLAMAHWGRGYALGPNINLPEIDEAAAKAAYEAVQRATSLAQYATEQERAYIHALAKRYPANPKADWRKPAYDFHVAMGQLSKRYPGDLHAATLYAESGMNLRPWKLYTKNGDPEEGTDEIVSTLEWVLARDSNHTGANHYYIHAVEASRTPERALPSAQRLPKLAPAAGHLVHMPAHIYIRMGDYAGAIKANEDAARVDEKFISCCGPKTGIYPAMYYSHNLHFLAVAAAMTGQSKVATDAARRLDANVEPVVRAEPMWEPFLAVPLLIAVRQAQWGEILKWPEPPADRKMTRAVYHFARGMAHASMKDVPLALAESEKFEAAAAEAKDLPMGNNTSTQVLKVAGRLLSAKVLAARGQADDAKRSFETAVAAQDDLTYDEPPAFPIPVREALGAFLIASGDAKAAEQVFQEDLARNRNNPRSLFGLSESLRAQRRFEKSNDAKAQFDTQWKTADVQLRLEDF